MNKGEGGKYCVGDSILVKVANPAPFDQKWDQGYLVTAVRDFFFTLQGPIAAFMPIRLLLSIYYTTNLIAATLLCFDFFG